MALLSITDEAAFSELVAAALADVDTFVDDAADELAAAAPHELLADWRRTRDELHAALRTVPDGRKLLWFGPPMSATSMATARLMETWAHGLDVADALGVDGGTVGAAAFDRPPRRAHPRLRLHRARADPAR